MNCPVEPLSDCNRSLPSSNSAEESKSTAAFHNRRGSAAGPDIAFFAAAGLAEIGIGCRKHRRLFDASRSRRLQFDSWTNVLRRRRRLHECGRRATAALGENCCVRRCLTGPGSLSRRARSESTPMPSMKLSKAGLVRWLVSCSLHKPERKTARETSDLLRYAKWSFKASRQALFKTIETYGALQRKAMVFEFSAPSGKSIRSPESCQVLPENKNHLQSSPNQHYGPRVPLPRRGVSRSSRTLAMECGGRGVLQRS
jgi:hypothetical protein